jgi:hypothetical protein
MDTPCTPGPATPRAERRQWLSEIEDRYGHHAEAHGWRPSNAQACPQVVAGHRCRVQTDADWSCVCASYSHLLDHARIWLDPNGSHVLTAEPYETHGDELAHFVTALTPLGLYLQISGASPWNPGATFMLTITARKP